MDIKANNKPRKITRILTISFVSFAVLNLAAFVIAFFLQNANRQDQNLLLTTSIPTQKAASELARSASQLSLYQQQIFLSADPETLADLTPQINHELSSLTEFQPAHADFPSEYQHLLLTAQHQTSSALEAQRHYITAREALSAAVQTALNTLSSLEFEILTLTSAGQANPVSWGRVQATVSAWRSGFLILADVPEEKTASAFQLAMRSELREVTRELSQTTDETTTAKLAPFLLRLLESSYASEGPFNAYQAVLDSQAASIAALRAAQISTLNLSGWAGKQLQNLEQETAFRTRELRNSTLVSQYLLAGLGIITIGLGFFIIQRYVHAGLAVPLNHLSDRTALLSMGVDIDHYQSEFDEFEKIERSLDVFALNARQLGVAQAELQRQNVTLLRSVEDLERFAYAASHDLHSPLRGVKTLTTFIEDDLDDNAPPAVRANLQRIHNRIEGLEIMLDDLLNYAVASGAEYTLEDITLEPLIREQLGLLANNEQVELVVATDLGEISAPPAAIAHIIRNILDNAIKHHPVTRGVATEGAYNAELPVRIQVQREERDGFIYLSLTDNGAGVPDAYIHKVKELFVTMRAKSEVHSSGLGLGLATKLLSRYGGGLKLANEEAGGLKVEIQWPTQPGLANPSDLPSPIAQRRSPYA